MAAENRCRWNKKGCDILLALYTALFPFSREVIKVMKIIQFKLREVCKVIISQPQVAGRKPRQILNIRDHKSDKSTKRTSQKTMETKISLST